MTVTLPSDGRIIAAIGRDREKIMKGEFLLFTENVVIDFELVARLLRSQDRNIAVVSKTQGRRSLRVLANDSLRLTAILPDRPPSQNHASADSNLVGVYKFDPAFVRTIARNRRHRTHGILVVCDEVLNLRQSYRGSSARYGIEPDLIAAGKIIGGGFPVGAIGGSRRVMSVFDGSTDRAKVAQGGTFSANPVSMVIKS